MIVYNISFKINPDIETEWVQWQQQEHIPEIMAYGQFTDFKFYRLLEPEQEDGLVYIVQYFSHSLDNYYHHINNIAPIYQQKALEKWGEQFIAFRTLMQVVN
ncbi:MAG: DUF4286 family protein [Bacteroidota bacterium]